MPVSLPIDDVLAQLLAELQRQPNLVLRAPPGAGKTTRVPPAILDAGLAGGKQVLLLQPRRVAARAAAARIASERQGQLGEEIGYQVRFERRTSSRTRLLVATEGILLRRLQEDPFLDEFGAIVFDEFHERNLNTELALAMVRRVQSTVRPELRMIVMSATLDGAPIAKWLDDCPLIESEGRRYPVDVQYLTFEPQGTIADETARGIESLLSATEGDLLAFLPGVGEIRRAAEALAYLPNEQAIDVCELYADLPLEQQQRVLQPGARRRVILSTNVAETSVTIPGVTGVVDSGWKRELRFDTSFGLNRLDLTRISRASADQRAGRAGRTSPGVCLRLWTAAQQRLLAEADTPEIQRVDLAGPVLELAAWGERDVAALNWFEPPPVERVAQAWQLLERLNAVKNGVLTSLGKQMARLPLHPRLARLLVEGAAHGHAAEAALVAALLSERDPFRRGRGNGPTVAAHQSDSDVLDRLHAIEQFARRSSVGGLDARAARTILRSGEQLLKLVDRDVPVSTDELAVDEALLRALWSAFPDRLAKRREPGGRRGVMIGGRGIKQAMESSVIEPELFVCVEAEETGRSESFVRQASRVERAWLDPQRLVTRIEVEFDPERERVVGFRRTCYEDLLLDEFPAAIPPETDTSIVLAREAQARLDPRNTFEPEELNQVERVRCLMQWMPELDWPAWGDDPWPLLWPILCRGCTSFADLRRASVRPALHELLNSRQMQALEREAPERLQVPSGSWIRLDYELGKPPVLAVRIQEVFGLLRTPRVAGGRIPVLMHLLAPNQRAEQVTQDLESFWKNTYGEVRKELRRRYPKHAWPEDPYTAQAERRPKRK